MKNISLRNLTKKTLSITGQTLLFIMERIDDSLFELNYPGLCQMLGTDGARRYISNKYSTYPKTIKQLRKNGWITARRTGDKIIIKLTNSGKVAAIQLKIANNLNILKGKSKIIIAFDIPESAKNARKVFRRSLKRMGFQRIQLSIWATDKDVAKELIKYVKLIKISSWVTIYFGNKLL